jgi:TRAP-type C4-dicarboxylate transport system substrate-binding protein
MFSEARIPGAQNVSIADIRKNGAWPMMEEAWAKNLNAHFLGWGYDNAQIFYTYFITKPKESTKTGLDLNGMKVRSTPLYNPFLQAMGATTVVMAPGDVYAGLQRGVVDGLAWPWGSVGVYGWQRFLKYRVKPDYFGASQPLLVNLDKWKGLNKAQQELLSKQALILEKDGVAILIKKGNEDDAKLKAAGVEDIELTGAVRKAYLDTIYSAKWEQNDKLKYTVDYKKLKSQPASLVRRSGPSRGRIFCRSHIRLGRNSAIDGNITRSTSRMASQIRNGYAALATWNRVVPCGAIPSIT